MPRTETGSLEKLEVHAGEKRGSKSRSEHPELPNKKKLVSNDGQGHIEEMAVAGS